MISIAMYACETEEEAASVAERLSNSEEWEVVLMQATTEAEGPPLICALSQTTAMDSASTATCTVLAAMLITGWDLLSASDPSESLH